jgi:hypothetical protein
MSHLRVVYGKDFLPFISHKHAGEEGVIRKVEKSEDKLRGVG